MYDRDPKEAAAAEMAKAIWPPQRELMSEHSIRAAAEAVVKAYLAALRPDVLVDQQGRRWRRVPGSGPRSAKIVLW